MKRTLQVFFSAATASVLALSALAQNTIKTDLPVQTRDHMLRSRPSDRLNDAAKASDIIGMTVKSYQDEKLGKVEDLAVDMESGRIAQVILSTGGFFGIGDSLTAVPPGALHREIASNILRLDSDNEKLKGSPRFEMSKWAECCDSNHLSDVYRRYGEEPAFKFIHRGDAISDNPRNPEVLSTAGSRTTDASWAADRRLSESQSMIPVSRLTYIQKASKLIGMSVKNVQEASLGKVENFLVDLPSGRIVAVVISSGGFLGLGDELSAVPPTALRFTPDRGTLQLDTSRELLTSAPHFKANQWPDFGMPTYAEGVYRAYRVAPYFTTNTTSDPDNTRINVRDRIDGTLTPLNQGNSRADLDITAQIRKEIVAGKGISVNAKNVKIITNQGRVTLRGPVNTAEEKRMLGEIASRIARTENVDNQLEVKFTPISN